jgi:hypothetical protein
MPLSLSKLPTTPKGSGRVALVITVLIGSAVGLSTYALGGFFHFFLAVSLPLCLGFVTVLLFCRLDRRPFSECLHAALSAVASLYILVLLYSAVMLVAVGPYSLMILMSAVMALPFVIALAFAGASLGYLIQKRSRRSATGAMGLALKIPRYDRRPT